MSLINLLLHPVVLIALTRIPAISSHGRLLEPPMRASVWRFKEFSHLNPPENYDDDAFWCGGLQTQHEINKGKCGVCGDDWRDSIPRSQEDGGVYGRGIIVRNYTAGQTIPLKVELTGAHDGFFTFTLCPRNSRSDPETEDCHGSNPLRLSTGSFNLPATRRKGLYHATAQLPPSITCKRCSLRWNYQAGNQWGPCGNGTYAVGCGNQETFRGCSDISIQ